MATPDHVPLKRHDDPTRLDALERTVYGESLTGNPGLLKRVVGIEEYIRRVQSLELMVKGALVFVGLSTAVNFGAAYALLKTAGILP